MRFKNSKYLPMTFPVVFEIAEDEKKGERKGTATELKKKEGLVFTHAGLVVWAHNL